MTDRLTEITKNALLRKTTGTNSRTPNGELLKDYVITKTTVGQKESKQVVEQKMLNQIITSNGGTPGSKYTSDLLKQALGLLSLPVSKSLNQNFKTLYLNLP